MNYFIKLIDDYKNFTDSKTILGHIYKEDKYFNANLNKSINHYMESLHANDSNS